MDDLDYKLVAELKINGRASVPALASILGVARGTIQHRLDKLIASGEIAGFTVRLRQNETPHVVKGVMTIELASKNSRLTIATVKKVPGVAALYSTNGVWDMIAEIEVQNLSEFNRVLTTIRPMDGIAKTETHLFLGAA